MSKKTYTIGEVAAQFHISVSAIRYYDKNGLLPLIKRTDGNIRQFSDEDLRWLQMIECLKNTGMQLKDIKTFFEWCMEGDSTIELRYEMFLKRREETLLQIEELKKSLDLINYKCEYYRIAKEAGTTNVPALTENKASAVPTSRPSQFIQDAISYPKHSLK